MKTTIIAIATILSMSNVFGSNKLYKNVVGNKQAGVITSTVCNGSEAGYLSPLKQNIFYYNSDESLKERISYVWDADAKGWIAVHKYNYEYNMDGKLINIMFVEWDNSTNSWKDDIRYAMYIYDENNEYSPVKYLSITD